MKSLQIFLFSFLLLSLGSCVEIIDDLILNSDGSGTFKYNVNLSSSKVKINSILALDSLDGKKVPDLDEIKTSVNRVLDKFKEQSGISNVEMDANYNDYVFKFSCDFESVELLQEAIKEVVKSETKEENNAELSHDWVSFDGNEMTRSIPKVTIKKSAEINQRDMALLKEGSYTSITRFEKAIYHFENPKAVLSKNGMAIMVRTDPYSLIQDQGLLDLQIYLNKSE